MNKGIYLTGEIPCQLKGREWGTTRKKKEEEEKEYLILILDLNILKIRFPLFEQSFYLTYLQRKMKIMKIHNGGCVYLWGERDREIERKSTLSGEKE